ncbi:MAG: hypothetical protein ABWY08_10385 [Comamonas sp.]
MNELMNKKDGEVPFIDICYGLYLFVDRLYKALVQREAADVLFFAREGQLLKEMFDFYQSSLVDKKKIKSHYLKVSRRSTFLLSLGPLHQEGFDVLFRQYRRISILDFLKSLDLVDSAELFARELGVSHEALAEVSSDLPTDMRFLKLLQLPVFREIYESQRLERSLAFSHYVKELLGVPDLPSSLHVVDVGWKGSIQDNVYHWFAKEKGAAARVNGYYVGLIAPGASNAENTKLGLLFSSIEGRTPGFQVFNENRSLYEVILHADHGSARRYSFSEAAGVRVIEDEIADAAMILELVRPVSLVLMEKFRKLVIAMQVAKLSDDDLLKLAVNRHGRMVFNPSKKEIEWIFSVSHVENFGVFEESWFGDEEKPVSLLRKMKFTWSLIMLRRPSQLGFWPWLTIRRNALPGMAAVYEIVRLRQSRAKPANGAG